MGSPSAIRAVVSRMHRWGIAPLRAAQLQEWLANKPGTKENRAKLKRERESRVEELSNTVEAFDDLNSSREASEEDAAEQTAAPVASSKQLQVKFGSRRSSSSQKYESVENARQSRSPSASEAGMLQKQFTMARSTTMPGSAPTDLEPLSSSNKSKQSLAIDDVNDDDFEI